MFFNRVTNCEWKLKHEGKMKLTQSAAMTDVIRRKNNTVLHARKWVIGLDRLKEIKDVGKATADLKCEISTRSL